MTRAKLLADACGANHLPAMRRPTHAARQVVPVLVFAAIQMGSGSVRCLRAQPSDLVSPAHRVRLAFTPADHEIGRRVALDTVADLHDATVIPSAGSKGSPAWVAWAAGGSAFAVVVLADEPSRDAMQDWRGEGSEEVARFGRWYGDWQSSAPYLLGGTLLIGVATRGSQGIADAAAVFAGTLAGSMSSEVVNQALGRRRPNQGHGEMSFQPLSGHASFPSGHTAFAFSFAGSIDAVTDGWFPAALAYGAATLTGLSRMHDDKHWLSDVVAGALIGTLVSRATAGTVRSLLSRGGDGGTPERSLSAGEAPDAGAPGAEIRLIAGTTYAGFELRF